MPSLGHHAVDLRRVEADIAALEKTAFLDPLRHAEVARYLYRLYARSALNGDLKELRPLKKLIDQAIERLGPVEDICLLKANLDFKLHRLAETKRDLNLVPALKDRREGRVILADVAFQEGNYQASRAALEELAKEDQTWDVLARLAHIESKMGDTALADELYARAEDEITAKEMRAFAWVQLQRGLLDLSRGRLDDALAHYDVADRAYSGYWVTEEHIGDALESPSHYERVLEQVDKPELAQKLGALYAKAGNHSRAQQLFTRALSDYLDSAERGEVHYYHHLTEYFADVVHDAEEAVKWAHKDIELRDNFNTQTALAWALHCAGQSAAGVPYIERALESGVKDAAIFSKAAIIMGEAGLRSKAHEYEHRAAHLNPLRLHVHAH